MKQKLIALCMFLGATACSGPGSSDLDIVRGRAVGTNSPAYLNTVHLLLGNSSCTGSIIGQRLILTAAHCVEGVALSDIQVRFQRDGVNKTIDASRVQTFKPEGAAFFPQFDIAWVELQENIPAPFKPMEILRDPSQLNSATPVLLAGYGLQSDDCNSAACSGKLMEGPTRLRNYYDKPHIMSLLVFFGDPREGLSGACYGDSGGPAYVQVNQTWFIAGVTNGVTTTLAPDSDGSCESGWDIYTFAGDYLPWLQKSSGANLPVAQGALNPDRAQPALVMSGPSQTRGPNTWADWVAYANHEDAAWYAVDSLVQYYAGKKGTPAALYDPALSLADIPLETALYLDNTGLKDLAPISLFTNLQQLFLRSDAIRDVRALNTLPLLKDLTFDGINTAPVDIFTQIPDTKKRLNNLTFSQANGNWLKSLHWSDVSVPRLTVSYSLLDLTPFSAVSAQQLVLESVGVSGRFEPSVAPKTLVLKSVFDQEQRPNMAWLGAMPQLKSLRLNRLPADSLVRLGDLSELTDLAIESMGVTQDQIERLTLPFSLQEISISGNRITSIPVGESWKALKRVDAYDNPLFDTFCPAGACNFDKYLLPKTLREYCENANAPTNYSYPYAKALWAINDFSMDCDTIERKAATVTELSFSYDDIDDIRPLSLLSETLVTLDLDGSGVKDLSPLSHMNRLANLYVDSIPAEVDPAMFIQNPGLRLAGIKQDPNTADCPIPAGLCYYSWKGIYRAEEGPVLGTNSPLNITPIVAVVLPGIGKTIQAASVEPALRLRP